MIVLRSSGVVVHPLAARRSPTDEFFRSATVSLGVDIRALTTYDGEHTAYQFEFDCIHDAAMRFSLCAFTLIICFKLGIMMDGAACSFCQKAFDFAVTCVADMVSTSD